MAAAAEPVPPCRSWGVKLCFPKVQTPHREHWGALSLCYLLTAKPLLCSVSSPVHLQKTQTWSSASLRHWAKPGQEMGAVCPVFHQRLGGGLASSTDLIKLLFQVILQWNCCSERADGMCSISPGLVQVLLFLPCHTADCWMHGKDGSVSPGWQLILCLYLYTGQGGRLLGMASGRESH